MCYSDGGFLVGDRDVLLGVLDVGAHGVPVWISGPQFQAWKHTQLVIDVVPGRGGGFSLEAPEGVRFDLADACPYSRGTPRVRAR